MTIPTVHFQQVPLTAIEERIARGEICDTMTSENNSDIQPQTTTTADSLKYPLWQTPLQAALMELDKNKLKERVVSAEAAIADRLQIIQEGRGNHAEAQALEDALSTLRLLKRDISGFDHTST